MKELGLNVEDILHFFPHSSESPYILVRLSEEQATSLLTSMREAVRRCYLSDNSLRQRTNELKDALGGTPEFRQAKIIDAKLPSPGSTMSGDFGEILVYVYQASKVHPRIAFGPKKWRFKQDRSKPAPFSDVVQFILPAWPASSGDDVLLCAEVKAKATAGTASPIRNAIDDCAKDRTSRLTKTLLWLKERALGEDLGSIEISHLDRFINTIDHPPAAKLFSAVVVICSTLVDTELDNAPPQASLEYKLIVISVPNLQQLYTRVFEAVRSTTISMEPHP